MALGSGDESMIVELGCGSGEKLVVLAEALQASGRAARVHLIDISAQALEQTEQRLTSLQHFSVVGHHSTYEVGLRRAAASRRGAGSMLVLLLGSNLGNFDTPAALDFLRRIRLALQPGDLLLLGADLVKPEPDLVLAYDDPLGVTAAFNKNLLVRINRELGGDLPRESESGRRARTSTSRRRSSRWASRPTSRCETSGSTRRHASRSRCSRLFDPARGSGFGIEDWDTEPGTDAREARGGPAFAAARPRWATFAWGMSEG
jgi:hypothetical protein